MNSKQPMRIDRRTTIKWLAATMAAAQGGCSPAEKNVGPEIPPAPEKPLGNAAEAGATTYGTDPDRMNPVLPWPKTMNEAQLTVAAALSDLILPADDQSPAASAVGVPDFIDEWISAPYPRQQTDRPLVLAGLEWLEASSRAQFATGFADLGHTRQTTLVDTIATPDAGGDDLDGLRQFFIRYRYLTAGAFYTTEAGIKDIGYVGNTPIAGEYPGPSTEAMAHLNGVLKQLGLEPVATR